MNGFFADYASILLGGSAVIITFTARSFLFKSLIKTSGSSSSMSSTLTENPP
jgi:hypothetical protein